MATRAWSFGVMGAAALLILSRCSLITGNFNECAKDADCPGGRVCVAAPNANEHYCVLQTIPAGCLGVPDAGIAATYGAVDAGNAIHVGATYAITTTAGPSTKVIEQLNAVLLALDEINQRGVGGRPFVLHVCDTQSDTTHGADQATWLAEQLNVQAVLVPTSPQVLKTYSVTVPRGVLLISPTATSSEITSIAATLDGGTRGIWRTAPSDDIQGKAISELLLGTSSYDAGLSGEASVGILYVNDAYGQGLEGNILTALTSASRTAQAFQYTAGGDINTPTSQLDSFIGQAPPGSSTLSILIGTPQDALRVVNFGETTSHLSRSSGHRWFFTDSAKDPLLVAQTAGAVEGDYGTAPAQGAGAAYTIFRNSFVSRFGADPNNYAFTAHNYDAMYVLALGAAYAVGPNGTGALTGERIAEGLTKLSSGPLLQLGPTHFTQATSALAQGSSIDIDGTSGQLNFDPTTGEAPSPIELWQVQDGGFTTVTNLTP